MTRKGETRQEQDFSGAVAVPAGALWGASTQRSLDTLGFQNLPAHQMLIRSLMLVKKAACQANQMEGRLAPDLAHAISQAADEVLNGQWSSHLPVSALQGPAGRPHNANVNELLANRANQILGSTTGTYKPVHPDRHVNLGQSATDVFSTAARLAILSCLIELRPVLLDLERLLRRKALEFGKITKTGRRQLKDSLPVTLGQEFNAYGATVERGLRRMDAAAQTLLELNLGATEVGTGIDADPEYVRHAVQILSAETGLPLRQGEDLFRLTQTMSDFVEFSSSLKELALDLVKIAGDLRLMSSGPQAGLSEIFLPAAGQASQSIMPGALSQDPGLTEVVTMVAFQVVGNDLALSLAAQAGQLEVNVMSPLAAHLILSSLDLIHTSISAFNQHCLKGLSANPDRCAEFLDIRGALLIALTYHVGHEQASRLLEESESSGASLRDLVISQDLLPPDAIDRIMRYTELTGPGIPGTTRRDTTASD